MQPTAILETALAVTDLEAAEVFYGELLGLEPISRFEGRHVFFRCGPGVLLLFNAEATRQPPRDARLPVPSHGMAGEGHLCFAASAQEITSWKTALESAGVAIEADFEWPGGGRSIYFRDPSGNSLEFAEPKLWGR
jgi:catechol 2,3-dioxygenase-like lactoylglutathione lyase family enzyme